MSDAFAARRARFRDLHRVGCFVLPNPWDAGSARRLAALGFEALASSSSAAALSLGTTDYRITLDQCLSHLELLCAATDLPVNADFENAFVDDPAGVARNVTRAIATGIAGLSVEDQHDGQLYPFDLAVARVAAARAAIDASGADVMLVARTEGRLWNLSSPEEARARLIAFAEAGADCLYAPGPTDMAEIADIVAAVAPKPVNILLMNADMRIADLARLGVRRVSTGGALANAAWQGFDAAAAALAADAGLA